MWMLLSDMLWDIYIKWSDVDVVRLSDMLWEIYIKWSDVDVVV